MTNITSLTCSEPRSLIWGSNITNNWCSTATLMGGGQVDVMCAMNKIPLSSDNPFAKNITWMHWSYLTSENQNVTCPFGGAMQLVGYLTNKLSNVVNLSLTKDHDPSCDAPVPLQSPASYLEYRLAEQNTTFTLGISNQTTHCLPPTIGRNLSNYNFTKEDPFSRSAMQYALSSFTGRLCQNFSIVDRTEQLGGQFSIECRDKRGASLGATSQVGDRASCELEKIDAHNYQSAASILYSPMGSEFGKNNQTFVKINRTVYPCDKKSVTDIDVK